MSVALRLPGLQYTEVYVVAESSLSQVRQWFKKSFQDAFLRNLALTTDLASSLALTFYEMNGVSEGVVSNLSLFAVAVSGRTLLTASFGDFAAYITTKVDVADAWHPLGARSWSNMRNMLRGLRLDHRIQIRQDLPLEDAKEVAPQVIPLVRTLEVSRGTWARVAVAPKRLWDTLGYHGFPIDPLQPIDKEGEHLLKSFNKARSWESAWLRDADDQAPEATVLTLALLF